MKNIRVIPYLAADGERLEWVRHGSLVPQQLLHKGSVQPPLNLGQPQHEDVLPLRGKAALKDLVATPEERSF